MAGWIKIYRDIINHWIWQNPTYLKAWITILLKVNHDEIKVLIEGELIICGRGQSLNSLQSWAKLFGNGWTIQRVRTFFELLKSDQMINTEGLRKTTRLTVCNYDLYQSEQQTENKETTNREQGDNKEITTNKNDKNDKECIITKADWKNSFEIYLAECKSAYKICMEDKEFLKEQSRLNPRINVSLSIEKGFRNFWGTEAGWKHKKKSRTKDIDWRTTIINSIGINKVYFDKNDATEKYVPSVTTRNGEHYK